MTDFRTPVPAAAQHRTAPARGLVALAAAMVVVGAGSVAALYVLFVRTRTGQRFDQAALLRIDADPERTRDIVGALSDLTIGVILAVIAVCMVVSLLRGRLAYAIAAAVLVAGANVSTQLLKHGLLTRPDLGYLTNNSLPSGHTTVAVSLALALLLVAPRFSRGLLVLVGSVAATVVGVGVVVTGWHRPSDVLASVGVCLAWAGLVSLWLLLRGSDSPSSTPEAGGHPGLALAGAVVAVALAFGYGVRPDGSWRDLVVHGCTVSAIGLGTALCLALTSRVVPLDR
ncbi:MAG TPA: phosphatase PAP2 family protein [Nocardioidaceae bacterium]|nr:phosphatase PAP2 family protein [Nocardioidaceae bacterium]